MKESLVLERELVWCTVIENLIIVNYPKSKFQLNIRIIFMFLRLRNSFSYMLRHFFDPVGVKSRQLETSKTHPDWFLVLSLLHF